MSVQQFCKLYQLQWVPFSAPQLSPDISDWLSEEGSLTARFERHCQQLTVKVVREGFVAKTTLLPHETGDTAFDHADRYWLREVILYGDGKPWLSGRTVLPEGTLSGPETALLALGESPLGRFLFTSSQLSRDFILPGHSDGLWGRYSLLRLSGKPLILTELFLPASPAYPPREKG
ncbi:chorismate lyase [Tatumella saanichensis]|uniref:chorismate lyase n=1 Tax=Tatumella saanichensis TaxID=480813 RepID=UPI0004A342DE|nr:chorismate lyase [Tatumella saanichensis]